MLIQKWELPYPMFLLIFLTSRTSAQFPRVTLNLTDCQLCNTTCRHKHILQLDPSDETSCLRCGCLENTDFTKNFTRDHPMNVPFLFSDPEITPAGANAEFSCMRWCLKTNCTGDGRNQMSLGSGGPLPDLGQQRFYQVRMDDTWLVILNLTLTLDASNTLDILQCRDDSKNYDYTAQLKLFAFVMDTPKLTGPEKVSVQGKHTWICKMNFVTMEEQKDLTNHLEFDVEVVDAGALKKSNQGLQFSETQQNSLDGVQVEKAMELAIPRRLMDTQFLVQCRAIQREVGVTKTSEPLHVVVPITDSIKEISNQLTTAGVIFGSLAVLITSGITIRIIIDSRVTAKSSIPSTPEENDEQINLGSPGGILKGATAGTPKSALKRPKAYSVSAESEMESSIVDSSSFSTLDLPPDNEPETPTGNTSPAKGTDTPTDITKPPAASAALPKPPDNTKPGTTTATTTPPNNTKPDTAKATTKPPDNTKPDTTTATTKQPDNTKPDTTTATTTPPNNTKPDTTTATTKPPDNPKSVTATPATTPADNTKPATATTTTKPRPVSITSV